ncbi:MAG TPA: SPASM domain-containing protein [Candidatus Nanoarchaeia archaeon]|nr:SPASM domain-containing protein [Candidatus Nanoarchaeia archaeon]
MIEKIRNIVPKQIKRSLFVRIQYWNVLNAYHNLKSYLHYGTTDMFHSVNIETMTQCNRRCSYCPNSIFDRSLPKNNKLMDESLFKKIIDDLAEMKYVGEIVPSFYGEPMMDQRLAQLMAYAHQKLPQSRLKIISNGDFLTVSKYQELVRAGVQEFLITQHSKEIGKNMCDLFQHFGIAYYENKQVTAFKRAEEKVQFTYRKLNFYYNRGGLLNLKEISSPTSTTPGLETNPLPVCYRYSNPLVFDYKGDVPLCCQDYNTTVMFGNVKELPVKEIWNKPSFKLMREQLRNREYKLPICKDCVGCPS